MRKMPTIFIREPRDGKFLATMHYNPEAQWVCEGEGIPYQKLDGSCCMIRDGRLYKRYDAKHGKTPPKDFEPAQPEADQVTGHWPGWVPATEKDYWHLDALQRSKPKEDGTYELVGPKVQSNPEGEHFHWLVKHDSFWLKLERVPRDFEGLRGYLSSRDFEGIVFHHPDGERMAKIKKSDFGLERKP